MQAAGQLDGTRQAIKAPYFRRVWIVLGLLALLVVLAMLPPYLNVNRFQRRITQSISEGLGRPVHLEHVTLNLLPVPSFTLEQFVVSEDPAFGAEPTIRADSVRATLRVSTLWRRRVEFATITLTDPSVNLVHLPDGRWNLDSILLQTSRMEAAPTAQRQAGATARFPYIEATGARINLKMDQEKTPVALTEADFAMWLPQPERWNFRIKARPTRTDAPVGYTGLLRLEGTVGRARTLGEIPIDLKGEWRDAPLGEVSRIVLGRDGDWRGDMTILATAQGTVGDNRMTTRVRLRDARRQDFVPERLLSVTAECGATVKNDFHGFSDGLCRMPADGEATGVSLSGELGDVRRLKGAKVNVVVGPLAAGQGVSLLHALSPRFPASLTLGGVLSGQGTYGVEGEGRITALLRLQGATVGTAGTTGNGIEDAEALRFGEVTARIGPVPPEPKRGRSRPRSPRPNEQSPSTGQNGPVVLTETTLDLGGREPAVVEGRVDSSGYTLHLTGSGTTERLTTLSRAVPQLGDGLQGALPTVLPGSPSAEPFHFDLVANRPWGGTQTWRPATLHPAATGRVRRRRRRP